MKSSRQIAFDVLNKIQRDNSYSNLLLDNVLDEYDLSVQDKNFTSALVYGVIERKITLDYQLSLYLSQPLKKLKPQVLTILEIGAYQLLFMDKVPASAAVNESVKLTKKNGVSFASGLVNAVLRKVMTAGLIIPDGNFSVKYSAPEWLCDLWIKSYGKDNAEKLLGATVGSVKTIIKVNEIKTSTEKLVEMLKTENINSELSDNIISVNGAVHKTNAYKNGLFHIQDLASQYCCKAVNPQKNDRILDICSAPGGKSFTLAEMLELTGEIVSCDIHPHRVELIKKGAQRLGLTNITAIKNDGTVFNEDLGLFDKVLCDVPCAGLGVIRKKPEIKYKNPDDFKNLPEIQYKILSVSSKYVKKNGVLIYSTCSLNPKENEEVTKRFLKDNNDFVSIRVLDELRRYDENTDYITLMPYLHNCDGFFVAGFKKIS